MCGSPRFAALVVSVYGVTRQSGSGCPAFQSRAHFSMASAAANLASSNAIWVRCGFAPATPPMKLIIHNGELGPCGFLPDSICVDAGSILQAGSPGTHPGGQAGFLPGVQP